MLRNINYVHNGHNNSLIFPLYQCATQRKDVSITATDVNDEFLAVRKGGVIV